MNLKISKILHLHNGRKYLVIRHQMKSINSLKNMKRFHMWNQM